MTPSGFNRAANSGRLAAAGLFGLLICMPAGRAQFGVAPPVVAEARRTVQPVSPGLFHGAMDFYVAIGPADACGPGCREWIAAEGNVDLDAGKRLQEFLNSPRRRTLPISFNSQGGFLHGALEIAKLLNDNRMTAGVGRTTPKGLHADGGSPAAYAISASRPGEDVGVGSNLTAASATPRAHSLFLAQLRARLRQAPSSASIRRDPMRRCGTTTSMKHPEAVRLSPEQRDIAIWRSMLSMGVDPELANVAARIDNRRSTSSAGTNWFVTA